ncbi:MAG: alpha/beta fold hydrolase [Pseudomonadota bacterium]
MNSVLEHPEAARIERLSSRHETPCGDGRMVWHVWGQGPPLVLLHGGFGSWLHWIRNVETLSRYFRVLAADIPGLGESDEAPAVTPAGIGTVVAAGIESLVGQESVRLAGFSFGGLISGQVGLLLGQQVVGITLIGASGMALQRPPMELLRRHDDMDAQARSAALRHNLNTLMLYHPDSIDPLALYIQEWNDARARVRSRKMSLGDSLAEAMPLVQAKLSGIWGELDATAGSFLPEREALIRAAQPDAPFAVIQGAGHWVMYEGAEAFNRTLLEFVTGASD